MANDEWAVQRARYMSLETITPLSDAPLHSADCGSLIEQPTLLRIPAPTPRPGARSAEGLLTQRKAVAQGRRRNCSMCPRLRENASEVWVDAPCFLGVRADADRKLTRAA